MSISTATFQYSASNLAVSSANAVVDAGIESAYSDLFASITSASSAGRFTVTYDVTGKTNVSTLIDTLKRYSYTVIQSGTSITVSWLTAVPTTAVQLLPANATGYLTNDGNGTLTWSTLPTATTSVLGGVKVDGTTVTISNGIITAPYTYTLPIATPSALGGIKIDNTSIKINTGVISVNNYTNLSTKQYATALAVAMA